MQNYAKSKKTDLQGIISFGQANSYAKLIVVSNDSEPRLLKINDVEILVSPWKNFLTELWNGNIF